MRCLKTAIRAAVVAIGLASMLSFAAVAQADTWADEHALACDAQAGVRATFIFDPGTCNFISQEHVAQDDLAGYYLANGFDRNFLNWAPTHDFFAGASRWAGCVPGSAHPGQLCPRDIDFGPLSGNVLNGRITAREWNGAFIALVCGNFSEQDGHGPAPRITGTKYEDRNGNGARDAGEPALGGVRITLRRDGVDVASTTTASDGGYAFTLDSNANASLRPGTYTLREDLPAGFRQTAAPGALGVGYAIGDHTFGGNDFGNQRMTDLVVEKLASKPVTIAGEDLEWTLNVTSRGLFDTPGVVVDDDLPAGVADVLELDPACTLSARHIHCALGTMSPQQVRVLRFRTRLRPDLDKDSTVVNAATVTSDYPDSHPADNGDDDSTTVDTRADLVTTKSVSTLLALGGGPVSYVVTVRNEGPSDARDVELRDPVPADVEVVSTTPGPPVCTVAGQLLTCAFGTLAPGQSRSVTVAGRAKGTPPPAPTPGNFDHHLYVDKVEQYFALDPGETRVTELTCNGGAIATDGSPRVAGVDQGTGTLASVKVLESAAIGRGTYRFKLRNDATGRAQGQLYVVCLSAATVGGNGPAHALLTLDPVSATRTLAVGRQTIALAVPLDYRAIAPSFSVASGSARLVASEPTGDGWALTFDVAAEAAVTAAVRPLRNRVDYAGGHTHLLAFTHVERSVTVPPNSVIDASVSCSDNAKGIVASFDLPPEITHVGNEPQPKTRSFRLLNGSSQSATALLDLDCLDDRTGPAIDSVVVENVATASSSTLDPDPGDNAAAVSFVLNRALGSANV
jgi:uncharacterized repeat protein (TIGR01451 family)